MKILFAGDPDILTEGILERLGKEENALFLLTADEHTDQFGKRSNCMVYRYDQKCNVHNTFLSVNPDAVIFEGFGYLEQTWSGRQKENLLLLSELLEEARLQKTSSFVLLSSTEVYGSQTGDLSEETLPVPDTLKGTWLLQCENMLETYRRCYGMTSFVLRLGPVFGKRVDPDSRQWLASLMRAAGTSEKIPEALLQPVETMDVADALVRVLASADSAVYNVCATEPVRKSLVMELAVQPDPLCAEVTGEPEPRCISNRKIKSELEWLDFWQIEAQLREHRIQKQLSREAVREEKKKKREHHPAIRRVLENLAFFAVFASFYGISLDHKLFSQVHWMLIYVMLIALCYGFRQGTFSVLLASAAYLIAERGSIFEMTNIYSYVANLLTIVEFIFFGVIIGYVVEGLRSEVRQSHYEIERLKNTLERLRDINEKNMFIKNEYEKRLLQTKNTIPNLYSIISRINVLDADRIFVELLNVVRKMVNTNTVAIYKAVPDSSYLRLITSLNTESLMENRSWNISGQPEIQKAIRTNTVYQGDIWKKEPAIVMSMPYGDGGSIVLVIKTVPMEQMSLYNINMLRTLFLLVSESLERAAQYEAAVREKKYIPHTNILLPEQFRKSLSLATEKERIEVADSVLLMIEGEDGLLEKYHRVESHFRELDRFGTDGRGELYVLLSNASSQDLEPILQRLSTQGVLAHVVKNFQAGAENG